jgi:hypothetical protein
VNNKKLGEFVIKAIGDLGSSLGSIQIPSNIVYEAK